jgi:hypothetical protein
MALNGRFFRALVSVCVICVLAGSLFAVDGVAPYKSPDLKTAIFGVPPTFDPDQQKLAATALAGIARNGLELSKPAGTRDAARLIGVALRLDPKNKAAVVLNGYLSDGQKPDHQDHWNQGDAVAAIRHAAETAVATKDKADAQAAAYLYASLLLVRADDDDRYALENLKTAGATVNWDWADDGVEAGPVAGAGNHTGPTPRRSRVALSKADRQAAQQSLRDQTTIRGLVVLTTGDGQPHGKSTEIIAVAPKGEEVIFPEIKAEGQIGSEMRISLNEAVRLAKLRDPRAGAIHLDISFDDKYTSKDGGSAGTAFTLLILSALNQFDLDPQAAITGDITVDEKIRPIGGLSAKLRGATLDHIRVVGIPASNLDQLREAELLQGPALAWDTQVIGIDKLDDAIAVMRKDRAANLDQAMKLFDDLHSKFAGVTVTSLVNRPEAQQALDKILELAPNHLSALTLKELSRGKGVKKLSVSGSMEAALMAMSPIRRFMFRIYMIPDANAQDIQKTRENLRKIRPLVDPALGGVFTAVEDYCVSADALVEAKKQPGSDLNALQRTCKEKAEAVRDAFRAIGSDSDVVDKLLRDE